MASRDGRAGRRGLRRVFGDLRTGKKLAIGFGLVLLPLLAMAVTTFGNIGTLTDNDHKVTHTYQVLDGIEGIEGVVSVLKDAETGQRAT